MHREYCSFYKLASASKRRTNNQTYVCERVKTANTNVTTEGENDRGKCGIAKEGGRKGWQSVKEVVTRVTEG